MQRISIANFALQKKAFLSFSLHNK